jgi:hypothetical protein
VVHVPEFQGGHGWKDQGKVNLRSLTAFFEAIQIILQVALILCSKKQSVQSSIFE